jgi:hypothetical protein
VAPDALGLIGKPGASFFSDALVSGVELRGLLGASRCHQGEDQTSLL